MHRSMQWVCDRCVMSMCDGYVGVCGLHEGCVKGA